MTVVAGPDLSVVAVPDLSVARDLSVVDGADLAVGDEPDLSVAGGAPDLAMGGGGKGGCSCRIGGRQDVREPWAFASLGVLFAGLLLRRRLRV